MGMKFVESRDTLDPVMPYHRYYIKLLKPYLTKKKILDIGCWTGPIESILENENCHVTGIDIENEPITFDKKRFPKFRFVKTSILEKSPFKKNEFDVVIFSMVIEHIPQGTEQLALQNINKLLKKGGKLLLTTMNSHPLSNLFDPAYFLTGHRHYSKKHLESLLQKAGFSVKKVTYNGAFNMIFYTWMLYFFKHILRRREPRGDWVDAMIAKDYKGKGFNEIDILAEKTREL